MNITISVCILIGLVSLCIIGVLTYVLKSKCGGRQVLDLEKGQDSASSKRSCSNSISSIEEILSIIPTTRTTISSEVEVATEDSSTLVVVERPRTLSMSSRSSKQKMKITASLPIPIPVHKATKTVYAEIPVMVGPLTPPRAVVLMQNIDNSFTPEEKFDAFMMKVRTIQQSLKTETTSSLKCNLVIAVHASTERIAGYCVNVKDKTCQLYTYGYEALPWKITDSKDNVELGANNLIFALLLWDKEIEKAKRVRLYVGNEDVIFDKTYRDVCISKDLIGHYRSCAKVSFINDQDFCVNGTPISSTAGEFDGDDKAVTSSYHDDNNEEEYFLDDDEDDYSDLFRLKEEELQKLSKFVQPVVDLSSWGIRMCEKHIQNMYDIDRESIRGTHRQLKWNKSLGRPWIETTQYYDGFLEKVRKSLRNWTPCKTCRTDLGFKSNKLG